MFRRPPTRLENYLSDLADFETLRAKKKNQQEQTPLTKDEKRQKNKPNVDQRICYFAESLTPSQSS